MIAATDAKPNPIPIHIPGIGVQHIYDALKDYVLGYTFALKAVTMEEESGTQGLGAGSLLLTVDGFWAEAEGYHNRGIYTCHHI